MHYEFIYRNRQDSIRYGIPFELKIKIPPPRKARIIAERNSLGKIVRSKTI